ncbi:MAG: hypothetical protein IID28_02845 [Planctomycetes bacterium]|nr:hypothetical protein [Planctomycetota bacterium]
MGRRPEHGPRNTDRAARSAHAARPLGLGTLADRLGKSRNALQTVHEPFLIRHGLIVRTPRGRLPAA